MMRDSNYCHRQKCNRSGNFDRQLKMLYLFVLRVQIVASLSWLKTKENQVKRSLFDGCSFSNYDCE